MSAPKTPRKNANDRAANRTNVLLEALQKDIRLVAEAVSGLTGKVEAVSRRVATVEGTLGVIEPVVRSLAPVSDELKSLADVLRSLRKDMDVVKFATSRGSQEIEAVKIELRLIRSDLNTFTKRLEAVEAKVPA